jgi:glycosyltransferase involved in cell wall biosynthesis
MPLKIGLLGVEDPVSMKTYSGTPYHLIHFLRMAGHEVRPCGPYPVHYRSWVDRMDRAMRKYTGKHLVWERHPLITRQYARIVDAYAAANPDLDLFLATSILYADKRNSTIPIFAWGDTTVAGVLDRYPYYSDIPDWVIRQSHELEQRGLDACEEVVFSSQWAADVALENYNLRADKVHVITYGANLLSSPSRFELETILDSRVDKPLTAVLVGVDWNRKGVELAIQAITQLRDWSFDVQLKVIGCSPPVGRVLPEFVTAFGRIAKDTVEGRQRFYSMLQQAHVFILPSVAECAAVSLAEANAFGIPVVASDIGGNGSLVRQGVNGFLCSLEDPATHWASSLQRIIAGDEPYRMQCIRAFDFYRHHLSWEHAVERFQQLAMATVGGRELAAPSSRAPRHTTLRLSTKS